MSLYLNYDLHLFTYCIELLLVRFCANKLDFAGDKRECPQLSLLPRCLSVPEISNTGPISGEVRRGKATNDPYFRKSPCRR
jgi:hypothetical protein